MKYETELVIDLPLARVIELFDSTENMYKWQPGLKGHEHLEGEPGKQGAKMKLRYEQGARTIDMIETIVEHEPPETFAATYTAKNVYNLVHNRFTEEGPDKTRWYVENEFRFKGMMALMSVFMRGAIAKQTLKDMNAFKEFAESA
jgi:hypothetical protein